MEIARNWALAKVQETERACSIVLKDDLFQAFHAENPKISRDTFLSYFGRFMGCAPFKSVIPHKKGGKILGYCHLSFKNNDSSVLVQKKEGTSKYDKCVLDDEVPIESKKEMTKFKTANERKSCLGVADVLEYDESSEKGFIELENKNTSDSQYTCSQTWRHGVENPNLLKENLICGKKLYKQESSRTVDPVASTCKESFDEPLKKKNKPTNRKNEKEKCNVEKISSEIETRVAVGTVKSCQMVACNDAVVENDLEFGMECNGDSGSNLSSNLGASILPPVDESADNDHQSTDCSSVPDVELVGPDDDRDIDDESDSDSSVFENGHGGGVSDCKVFQKARNVDAGNQCNFRKVESESSLFNSNLFFENDLWKDPCKNMRATKLPGNPKSCEIFLDSLFKGSISEDLLKSVGVSKDHKLTKLRSFIAACFEAPVVGTSGCHEYLQCDRPGNPYPQFSCSKSSSSITCEICVPYQRWAFENKVSHASLRSRGATLDKILSNAFTPSFSGLRQVYEHSISKSHLEAIAFLECCEKNTKSVKSKEKCSKQQSLHSFFPSKKSETVPLN